MTVPTSAAPFCALGLTGPMGGGKTHVRERLIAILPRFGVSVIPFSFSAIIRVELEARGLEATRDMMNEVGNDLRRRYGSGVLAERILAEISRRLPGLAAPTVFIAEALRNPGEVIAFRRALGDRFCLVAVTARDDILAQRLAKRGRDLDVTSGESTLSTAARWIAVERGSGQPSYGQQTQKCIEMADLVIDNSGGLDELDRRVDDLVADILNRLGIAEE